MKNEKAKNPSYKLQKKDFKDFLYKGLTRTEKLVLNLYYANYVRYRKDCVRQIRKWHGMPQLEIGKVLGVKEARVSQIRSELLLKLKEELTAKGLTLETCLNNL